MTARNRVPSPKKPKRRRAEVARERKVAAKLSAQMTREVEEMIFGTRPVKGAKA